MCRKLILWTSCPNFLCMDVKPNIAYERRGIKAIKMDKVCSIKYVADQQSKEWLCLKDMWYEESIRKEQA